MKHETVISICRTQAAAKRAQAVHAESLAWAETRIEYLANKKQWIVAGSGFRTPLERLRIFRATVQS